MRYILDACAMIAHLDEEPGAEIVDDLIERCEAGEIELFMNAVQVLEVYYDRRRKAGTEKADKILEDIYASPIHIVDQLPESLVREAGRLKTSYKMSLGQIKNISSFLSSLFSLHLLSCKHDITTNCNYTGQSRIAAQIQSSQSHPRRSGKSGNCRHP
jgi:predicted nucleic acid-binding protein